MESSSVIHERLPSSAFFYFPSFEADSSFFYSHLGFVCFALSSPPPPSVLDLERPPPPKNLYHVKLLGLLQFKRFVYPCEMLGLSSLVTASPGIEKLQWILVLTQGKSDDNETVLLFTSSSPSVCCSLHADHTDRPDCPQDQGTGLPGFSGLSWIFNGSLLCG